MSALDQIIGGIGGWFGQQTVPDLENKSSSELLAGLDPTILANKELAYNRILAPGLAEIQSGVEDTYDPNAAALRHRTTDLLVDDLKNPYAVPFDVQNTVIRKALERTGPVGASQAGRNLVAADLGLTSMDLFSNRLNRAMNYVRSSPSWNSLFSPDRSLTPAMQLGMDVATQEEGNAQKVYKAQLESANNQNLIRGTLTNDAALFGTVAGAVMGSGGGGGNAPVIQPGTYGGSGQPSYSTLAFAAPAGARFVN